MKKRKKPNPRQALELAFKMPESCIGVLGCDAQH